MTDPTIAAWSRENDLLFQLRQLREENERLKKEIAPESAYQRGYLDGIGRDCPHCKDYRAMYIKVRDELAAEQQITQQQTARIVDLQTHIENLEGE